MTCGWLYYCLCIVGIVVLIVWLVYCPDNVREELNM